MDKILEGNDNIDDEQYMAPRVTKEEMRDVMLEHCLLYITSQ